MKGPYRIFSLRWDTNNDYQYVGKSLFASVPYRQTFRDTQGQICCVKQYHPYVDAENEIRSGNYHFDGCHLVNTSCGLFGCDRRQKKIDPVKD